MAGNAQFLKTTVFMAILYANLFCAANAQKLNFVIGADSQFGFYDDSVAERLRHLINPRDRLASCIRRRLWSARCTWSVFEAIDP